jgi:hypothetical protein
MPIDPRMMPYGPPGPMAGPQPPVGPQSMWAGGGSNPGFPPGPPGAMPPGGMPPGPPRPPGPPPPGGPMAGPGGPPPGAPPDAQPGMPLGLTPEILNIIKARMAEKQFRPGPDDSLIPTGQGGGLADLMPGGY